MSNDDVGGDSAELQAPSFDPYGQSLPTYLQFKNQSEIIKLLKIPDYLQEFELRLKGFSMDYRTQAYVRRGEQMVSDKGVEHLMTIIHAHCNNILTMSSFDEERVRRIMYDASIAVIELLFYNGEKYSIRKSNFNIIMSESKALIVSCLMRAKNTELSDKSFLMTTERRIETYNTMSGTAGMGGGGGGYRRSGGGFMNKFMGFLGRGGEQ